MAAVGGLFHQATLPEDTWMNFYTHQPQHYGGLDLHAQARYVGILDQSSTKLVHKNLTTTPDAFLRLIAPFLLISSRDRFLPSIMTVFDAHLTPAGSGRRPGH